MDSTVKAMWIGLWALVLLNAASAALFIEDGFRVLWLVQLGFGLLGGWALIGAAIGLARNLRGARA